MRSFQMINIGLILAELMILIKHKKLMDLDLKKLKKINPPDTKFVPQRFTQPLTTLLPCQKTMRSSSCLASP